MNNRYFNASHTDAPPPNALSRPKHDFKGIDHADAAAPEDVLEATMGAQAAQPTFVAHAAQKGPSQGSQSRAPSKFAHRLPAPKALSHHAPADVHQILGLPSLPAPQRRQPRTLDAVLAETQGQAASAASSGAEAPH